jgi:hypothetical protein
MLTYRTLQTILVLSRITLPVFATYHHPFTGDSYMMTYRTRYSISALLFGVPLSFVSFRIVYLHPVFSTGLRTTRLSRIPARVLYLSGCYFVDAHLCTVG